jgi:Holliday junction resolvase RusA-like endonuclease
MILRVLADVDPGELSVNLKFRGSPVLHPRVRKAKDDLILQIKNTIQLMSEEYQPCSACKVYIRYSFTNSRFDVDGPLKRTIDAIQEALNAVGYEWNDKRIEDLRVIKWVMNQPQIVIEMSELGE